MIIDKPKNTEPLRQLWKQAFGDSDAFLDAFFTHAYSPNRCRQIAENGTVVAALYWFDCAFSGKKIAYLYAVATDEAYRNRGLCRLLMEDTHRHLKSLGYDGTLLVPGSKSLFSFYEKLGYRTCCNVNEFTCKANNRITLPPMTLRLEDGTVPALPLRAIDPRNYYHLRQRYLPAGYVEPDISVFEFMKESGYSFYAGNDFIFCGTTKDNTLIVAEFLGNTSLAPGIVALLGMKKGQFRTIGEEKPFAMYHPLTHHLDKPSFFALALD